MKVKREENFDPETFPWSKKAKKTIGLIKSAGMMDRLKEYFDVRFGRYAAQPAEQINSIVVEHPKVVLDECGLDEKGRKKTTKKFKVFVRIEGVLEEEAEAETPEEAARKVYADLNDGDPIISIIRSDVDSMKPVSYEEEGGSEKEYPEDFDVEEE